MYESKFSLHEKHRLWAYLGRGENKGDVISGDHQNRNAKRAQPVREPKTDGEFIFRKSFFHRLSFAGIYPIAAELHSFGVYYVHGASDARIVRVDAADDL